MPRTSAARLPRSVRNRMRRVALARRAPRVLASGCGLTRNTSTPRRASSRYCAADLPHLRDAERTPVAAIEDPERRLLDERGARDLAAVLDERERREHRALAERVVRGRAEARVPVDVDERPADPDAPPRRASAPRGARRPAPGARASRRRRPRAPRGGSARCARSAARRPSRRTRPARRRRAPSRARATRARAARACTSADDEADRPRR